MIKRIGYICRNITVSAVLVVFMEKKHIMSKNMTATAKKLSFAYTTVLINNCYSAKLFIYNIYKKNIQIWEKKNCFYTTKLIRRYHSLLI